MAAWATEVGVRLRVQVDDVGVASSALVTACIEEAHERILAELDESIDVEAAPEALAQGETLLAAAGLMSALASGDAAEQVSLQIGGQRIDGGQRFASLLSVARRFEKEAAVLLAPYMRRALAQVPGDVTKSIDVLGD